MVVRFCILYEKSVSYVTYICKEQLDDSQTQELQDHI